MTTNDLGLTADDGKYGEAVVPLGEIELPSKHKLAARILELQDQAAVLRADVGNLNSTIAAIHAAFREGPTDADAMDRISSIFDEVKSAIDRWDVILRAGTFSDAESMIEELDRLGYLAVLHPRYGMSDRSEVGKGYE